MAKAPLHIRYQLTGTPLEREHGKLLTRRDSRAILPIPWRRFVRSRYPEAALKIAAEFHTDLAAGELLAVDSFSRVAAALALVGAPLDLINAAVRVPCDEIRHADYNLRMIALFTGRPIAEVVSTVSGDELALRERAYRDRPHTLDQIDGWMLEVPTFGETLACALLLECATVASDPVARALYRSVVADEIHHSRLGWYYFAWRSPQWTRPQRQRIADRAARLLRGVLQRFGHGRDVASEHRRAARALGVLDTETQRAALVRTIEEELVPGLDALGLGSSAAWRAIRNAAPRPGASWPRAAMG